MIRVMITDDHLIVREGLRLILETADDLEVVGDILCRLRHGIDTILLSHKLVHEPPSDGRVMYFHRSGK